MLCSNQLSYITCNAQHYPGLPPACQGASRKIFSAMPSIAVRRGRTAGPALRNLGIMAHPRGPPARDLCPHFLLLDSTMTAPRLRITPSTAILSDADRAAQMSTLAFGRTFTDHMVVIPYRDGAWQQGEVKAYGPLSLDPAASVLQGGLIVLLLFVVGTLMVSTVRFPSSKQKKSWAALVALLVNLGLLAWLQTTYFVLFFALYIALTLALNAAWKTGWTGVAPPVVYHDED